MVRVERTNQEKDSAVTVTACHKRDRKQASAPVEERWRHMGISPHNPPVEAVIGNQRLGYAGFIEAHAGAHSQSTRAAAAR
jgi:hypothetical protein